MVVEADKRPVTWEEMQPVYEQIKKSFDAVSVLIFALIPEEEYAATSSPRKLLRSQGNHEPWKGHRRKKGKDNKDAD